MKIKSIICILILFLMTAFTAQATQLPKEVNAYLSSQKKVPTVRYDGVVIYNDNVMYLPIFPAYPETVDTLKIVQTYPKNQTLDQFPEMVLFNNNFSLLKVIRTNSETLTVREIPDLPAEVKTGLLPQDIVVPKGLVLPESFSGILGDVQVPLIGSAKSASFVSGKKTAPLPSGKRVAETKRYTVPEELKNKLFFVNNFQNEYLQVFSPSISEPLYSLKTSGVMKDIKPILNGKYILAATSNLKNVDLIDINNEYVAKTIDLTALPSEIAVDEANKKAYVASIKDESLSVIDLNSMIMREKIQLVGSPNKLSISSDGTKIAYEDMKTSGIYVLDLANNYENKLISTYPNATKLILKENVIFVISRTQPKLRIVQFDLLQDNKITKTRKQKKQDAAQAKYEKDNADDITESLVYVTEMNEQPVDDLIQESKTYSTSIRDINIGAKPVDMYIRNGKVYVLCAGDNKVYSYDIATDSLNSTSLNVEGFSKSFTPVADSNLAVVTNMGEYRYVVYDMDKEQVLQTQPINEHINMITILEKSNEH